MTNRRDPLIERLESWLVEEDGAVLSERVMDTLIAELPATRQEGAGWTHASLSGSRVMKAGYALAGLAAAAALVLVYAKWTPDNLGEPSPSPEPSGTRAPEQSPIASPAPVASSGLDVGGVGIVVATEPLVLRSAPGTGPDSAIVEGSLWPGMRFGIVEGPVTASGYDWYLVRVGELGGWAAMASREGEPWMASVVNGLIAYGGFGGTTSGNQDDWVMELRAIAPGRKPSLITSLPWDDLQLETDLNSAAGGGAVDCPGGLTVAWSPQGDQIALAAHGGCNGVIYTVDADGTDLVRHSDGQNPVWSPDGTRVAFGLNAPWFGCDPSFCERPPGGWEIQVAQPHGGDLVALTRSASLTSATSPLWSPDGRTIAFLSTDLSVGWPQATSYEVHLINADGSGQRFLSAGQPIAWSPDGRSLLLNRSADLSLAPEIWVVRADGSGAMRLPAPEFSQVAWSPDGQWIAVSGFSEETGSQAYLVRPDGSDVTSVPIPPDGSFLGWSPDGRHLVVVRGEEIAESGAWKSILSMITIADGEVQTIGEDFPSFMGFAWQPVLVYPAP